MIKIILIVTGFLSSNRSVQGGTDIIEIECNDPVTVRKLLMDTKIKVKFLGLIMLNGKNVDQDFLINKSCKIKLFPLMGGG